MKANTQIRKKNKRFWGGVIAAALLAITALPVYAMEDGAYTVTRTTSYANPETGQTADGGTNIALGDSMCASIVEETVLVEQSQGKTYVTLGIGLISNVSDVRIQVQGADGVYKNAEIIQTGSCERNGDGCNHYRFEVDSADLYISPILYVTPMGRDVQFFVKLDMTAPQAGTGNFVSEMITAVPETTEEPVSAESEPVEEPEKETDTKTDKKSKETSADKTDKEDTKDNTMLIAGVAIAVVVIVGAGAVIIYKKRKK